MERLFKKRLGFIILIIIALVFPISLSNQARLNTRVIVTGLAIDKVDDKYEVTAQFVKTTPGTESPGTGAEIEFVSDSDETMIGALSKLTYKAGKVAAFSHTNFVVVGKDILDENLAEVLDYFVRHKTIKSSALLLFADGKASEEIKKTKDIELSVGIGLQKVFLFKESEGDGEMMTILNFLNDSKSYSQTSTASTLKLMKNEESSQSSDGASSQGSSSSSGGGSTGDGSGSSSSSGESSQSSSESSSQSSKYQYFEAISPIVCCVEGEYVGKLETDDEIIGYMILKNKAESEDISLSNINVGRLKDAKVGVRVNHKNSKRTIRFENGMPKLDIVINFNNAEIEDLRNKELISELSTEEYQAIKEEIETNTKQRVSACFEKAKSLGADIFRAYDIAMKYHYEDTTRLYDSMQDFLKDLKINVSAEVIRLDY